MDQRFTLDRTSFEQLLATASLLQQLQRRAIYLDSCIENHAPQLVDLVNTQQAIQTGTLSLEAAFDRISALALRLVPAQGAGVWLFSGDAFLYRAGAGTARNNECLRNAVLSRLASAEPAADSSQDDEGPRSLVKSLLVAPIYQGQKIAGALAVFSENSSSFNEQDETSARLLSGLAAQALDKAANARFKQTVTLERAAVLHVIGTLVPSLEELVGTTKNKYTEGQSLSSVNFEANQSNNAAARSVENPGLLIPGESPIGEEAENIRDLLSQLRASENALPIQEAPESKPIKEGGVSDVELPTPPERVVSVREAKSGPVHEAVSVTPREVGGLSGSADAVLARARLLTKNINILAIRASLSSWSRRCSASCGRFVNHTSISLNEVAAYLGRRKFPMDPRLVTAKRFGPAVALLIVAAFLIMRAGVSKSPILSAKTTTAVSLQANNAKKVETVIVDVSHKRVTDAATSAALADLSRFEIPGLLRQAQYGDRSAAFMIGMAYETGQGVPQNCEKAARWVKEAAMAGKAAAEYNLSLRYRDGDGLLTNSEESEKWLRKAAQQKYAEALTKAAVTPSDQTRAGSLEP
jgi:GAF domain/Sel1 repeat